MAFVHGKSTLILCDQFDLSAYFNEASFSGKVQAADDTTFGKNSRAYLVGLTDGTVGLKGFFDSTATVGYDVVISNALGRATDMLVSIGLEGSWTIGKRIASVHAVETDYSITSPVANVVGASAGFTVNTSVAKTGVSLHSNATVEATIGAAQVFTGVNDLGLASPLTTTNGGLAILHVTSIAGTGSPTISAATIETSDDNSSYATLATFTGGIVATGAQWVLVPPGTTINRFNRFKMTTTGSTISTTFLAGFIRF